MIFSVAILLPLALSLFDQAGSQEIRITTTGTSERPYCTAPPTSSIDFHYAPFKFSVSDTLRYATSLPQPTATTTYAPPYASLSSILESRSTTTWGSFLPNVKSAIANDTADKYGQAAWTSLWLAANIVNYTTTGLYSTTVSPTPVPTSELVLPPADYLRYEDCYNFPEGFIWGVAGSACQSEGAVGLEGRSPSIQEVIFSQYPTNNYVSNEHYYLYKQDIERLAAIGTEYYSFTISWNRILPFVLPGTPINKQGVDHYNDVLDTVIASGMKPMITLLHFDNPFEFMRDSVTQTHDFGYHRAGWDNVTWPDAFLSYGKLVMSLYGDRVPIWITINEPMLYAANAKGLEHVVRGHAALYHWYKNVMNGTGMVGFKLNNNFGVPLDPNNSTHRDAADWFNDFWLAPVGNPICLGEDYPTAFKQTIKNVTSFNAEDLAIIGNTTDFFGVDPYTPTVISPPPGGIAACAANSSHPLHPLCVEQTWVGSDGWEIGYGSEGTAAYIAPKYFREYFSYLWNKFKKPVFITEFGFPVFAEGQKTLSHQRFDLPRSQYYTSFMSEVLKSIWEDGVDILGVIAWTFVDDWE
ncbi:glycoside hydrolase family 1 protein [Coleophoma cylindrospora]|uniref:Glycoside hydrolase family 1 protein n=1 Tax=Coleophoma cylindrospora TaxID=1849047 RepID=A0A3D8SP75_9HELO|nr:glycoside hydrolase family 1 protein [Coleophoma cylindrospora]